MIFTITPGYYLVALNALTGDPVPTFGAGGFLDLQRGLRLGPGRTDMDIGISFPPLVVGDVVIAGAAHEVGMRPLSENNVKGDIRGFDARTGEQRWQWDPIPRDKNRARYQEWLPDQVAKTGAANAWAPLAADLARDLLFIPTGSASPDFYGGERLGANRWANSLVVLAAGTGGDA